MPPAVVDEPREPAPGGEREAAVARAADRADERSRRVDVAARAAPSRGGRVRVEALLDAGFARGEAEAYTEHLDALALRGLELRDEATRDGWLDTRRFREENAALRDERDAARERFGDELTDWALYSTGRPNRMQVESVIVGSAAAEAGLQVGDIVERYDEARVLDFEDLRAGTTSGRAGDLTALDVRRDGESLRVFVPRGPLGVQLRPARVKPPRVR